MEIPGDAQLVILKRRIGDDAVLIGWLADEVEARGRRIEELSIRVSDLESAAVDAAAGGRQDG